MYILYEKLLLLFMRMKTNNELDDKIEKKNLISLQMLNRGYRGFTFFFFVNLLLFFRVSLRLTLDFKTTDLFFFFRPPVF